MNHSQQQRFNYLYEQHLINLRLQGKRPATIDAYSRAVRRISAYFDKSPDELTTADLKTFFNSLIQTHSRQRNLHPHLHIIVASGSDNTTRNQWHKGKSHYLFNAFALAKVWRARMLDAIKNHANLSLANTETLPTKIKHVIYYIKKGSGLLNTRIRCRLRDTYSYMLADQLIREIKLFIRLTA